MAASGSPHPPHLTDSPAHAFPVLDPASSMANTPAAPKRAPSLAFVPGLLLFLLLIAGILGMEACAGSRLSAFTGKHPAPVVLEIEQPEPLARLDDPSASSVFSGFWSWLPHP